MRAAGTFNGTGARVYIGIGFVPDWVVVDNLEDATGGLCRLEWNINMLRGDATYGCHEGILLSGASVASDSRLIADGGLRRYFGGDVMTAASTAYLVRDAKDYRVSTTYGAINKWTLGSSANRTGNFNLEADTTYIGQGSPIWIDGRKYFIMALTSNGEAANEVTLNESVSSGKINKIGRLYDYVGAAAGVKIPAGFSLLQTTVINYTDEMYAFEAGTYM